jgi:ABC-type antimicrobial peptide transport system permease subunit
MKRNEIVEMTRAEKIFLGVCAVVVLFILAIWSAEAMLLGAGSGLVAYTFLFRKQLQKRGWLIAVIPITVAAVVGAAVAVALSR